MLRKLLLTVHIGASVGWLGAVLAYIPLDALTATSTDAPTVRAAYLAMDVLVRWAILPLALVALTTGIAVSLTTRWGLLRHYWTVVSLLLTVAAVVVLLLEVSTIRELARLAYEAPDDASILQLPSTLPHSVGGAALLAVVLALNVYKPPGLTRRGWRAQARLQQMPTAGGEPRSR